MRSTHRRLAQEPLELRTLLSISPTMIDLDSLSCSDPCDFVQVGEMYYFTAETTDYGRELWVTDGTEDGTHQVKDINDGSDSSDPTELIEFDGKLYFAADDGENGMELWVSDGTESGTVLVKDINDEGTLGSSPTDLTIIDGVFYFCAEDADHGAELWKSDGTESGTVLVKDIYTGTYTSGGVTHANSSSPVELVNVDGTLFFVAEDGANGLELWKSDGTEDGTVLVADINEGSGDAFDTDGIALIAAGDKLFFVANDGESGYELWTSDGTESGTTMVLDIYSGSADAFDLDYLQFVTMDGILYFAADDGTHGDELWRSDGTESGTYLLKDINEGSDGNLSFYTSFKVVGDTLYFSASDGETGKELWKTDGTESGTVLVKDIYSGSGSSYPFSMFEVDGVLYFTADTEKYGCELWKSDGTEEGTLLVVDSISGSTGMIPHFPNLIGDYLIFAGETDDGYELYSLDLTTAGVRNAQLSIWIDGEEVTIPADIGVYSGENTADIYTTDNGDIIFDGYAGVTLGELFEIWRTNAGTADDNAAATFNSHELMGNESDSSYTIQMFVNGEVCTDFENYVMDDNDEIILVYSDNPVVAINTNFGSIVIELFEDDTPITVENFLDYINNGDYINSIFHRSDPDFVIQGGGYTTSSSIFTNTSQFTEIDDYGQIENESLLSNLYGTIAMARTSGYDSATNQFFINLDDNDFLDPSSSTSHDGYTVFGRILDMTAVETIKSLPIDTTNDSPFKELPYDSSNKLAFVKSIEGQGDITGYKFYDTDHDGIFDSDEEGIEGVTVFIDANDNGELDDGEIWATTDADGKYLLQAEAGTYTVCAEDTSGNIATIESIDVTVEIGVETDGIDFGEIDASAPVGNDDSYTMSEDDELDVDEENGVLANDIDPEDVGLTVTLVASPQHGTVTLDADGSFKYVPYDDFAGTDTFTYQAANSNLSNLTTVTITVENTPDSPVADNDGFEVENNGAAHDLDVMDNDSDPDVADSMTIVSVTQGSDGGTVSILSGDEVLYKPENGFTGTETFTYTIRDEQGNEATATVTMTVNEGSGNSNSSSETGDSSLSGYVFLDTDGDGQFDDGEKGLPGVLITLTGTSDNNNSISETRLTDNNGYYSFDDLPAGTYTLTETQPEIAADGEDSTSVADATVDDDEISDIALDDDESFEDNSFGEKQIQSKFVTIRRFFSSTSLPKYLRTLVAYGEERTGDADLAEAIRNGVTDYDNDPGNSDPNATPVGEDDSYSVDEDETLTVDVADGVLDNDGDDDDDTLIASLVSGPENGTLLLDSDGSFEYTPEANFSGTDTFTYVVYDGTTISDTVTVTIAVTAENDAPVATEDDYSIGENTTLDADVEDGLLDNDTDADDDTLSAVLVSGPENGTLSFNADGSFEYTPNVNFVGTDSFTYYAKDNNGLTSDTVTVTIHVEEGEDVPVATADEYTVDEDNKLTVDAEDGLLDNDTDADDDTLEAYLETGPSHGEVTIDKSGSFEYTPNEDYYGTDTFTYYVTDGTFESTPVTVTITIESVNDLPVAADDEVAMSEIHATDIDVLANDTDVDTDDTLTIESFDATSAEGATITLNTDGTLHYDPSTSATLTDGTATSDSFTYTMTDGNTGVSVTGTVTIVVDSGTTYITFNGDSISVDGTGVTVDGSTVTLTAGRTYSFSGTLDDGQIIVNTDDEEDVILILNGVDITCSDNAPIYVANASNTVITLADGTENYLTDGDTYTTGDPDAAIYSNCDLVFEGAGSLTVVANYNDGISSLGTLDINSGTITVTAVNHGISGKDSVDVLDGTVTVTAGGNGVQSTNDEDTEKGYVSIEGGTLDITADSNGIQAETTLTISGGDITLATGDDAIAISADTSVTITGGDINITTCYKGIESPTITIDDATIDIVSIDAGISGSSDDGFSGTVSISSGTITIDAGTDGIQAEAEVFISGGTIDITAGGGSDATLDTDQSAKGLKADADIIVTGGTITIDSADDAIHSDDTVTISGGDIAIASGSNGIHAENSITIDDGNIDITKSCEGIKSTVVTINDGTIHLVSSDDGINIAGGNTGNSTSADPDAYFKLNGGYVFIDTEGDGCDSNGSVYMDGGILIINGPTNDTNGALGYNGTFEVTDGFLLAIGSPGMAGTTSDSSSQETLAFNYDSMQSAGTMIHIETEDGEEILTFVPTKDYQSFVLCSANLQVDTTYVIYSGGSHSGIETDGLYTDGTYTPGTEIDDITIE